MTKKTTKPKTQILFAVLDGILRGELPLCSEELRHKEDRHSFTGWIQWLLLQEEGWVYDVETSHAYLPLADGQRMTWGMGEATARWYMNELNINETEYGVLSASLINLYEKYAFVCLLDEGFRFYTRPGNRDERLDHYHYYRYQGIDERIDENDAVFHVRFRNLLKRYFNRTVPDND